EQLQLAAGDLLLLDRHDLAHAMGRIHDELVGLEALSLGGLFGGGHSWSHSLAVRATAVGLCFGGSAAGASGRGARGAPASGGGGSATGASAGGLRGPPATGGGGFVSGLLRLRPMTRFCGHSFRVDVTPLYDGSSGMPRKIRLPTGSFGCGVCSLSYVYNTFSS